MAYKLDKTLASGTATEVPEKKGLGQDLLSEIRSGLQNGLELARQNYAVGKSTNTPTNYASVMSSVANPTNTAATQDDNLTTPTYTPPTTSSTGGGSNETSSTSKEVVNDSVDTGAIKDYYNLLKNESYKSLLDSQIQAALSRQQAYKYTQNTLNNSGYANQGLAQSTQLGIANNYANALNNAQQNYYNALGEINKQILSDEATAGDEEFKNFVNLLENVSTKEQFDRLTNAETGYNINNFTDRQKQYLAAIYSILDSNMQGQETQNAFNNVLYKFGVDPTTAVEGTNGDYIAIQNVPNAYKNKIKGLKTDENGNIKNGEYFKNSDEKSGLDGKYYVYWDGYLIKTTKPNVK